MRLTMAIVLAGAALLVPRHMPSQTASSTLPAKINVAPVSTENKLGTNVPLRVDLRDSEGRAVGASKEFAAEVNVQQPSGQVSAYTLTFAPGESSKEISVPIDQAGVAKLSVKQQDEHLIGGTNFVLVRPARNPGKYTHRSAAKKPAEPAKGPGAEMRGFVPGSRINPHLVYAAFSLPQVAAATSTTANPQLVLTVSGEDANGGTRADGTQCAQVQAFYLGSDDLQHDIEIWLSASNGNLDKNPVVIKKGTTLSTACWTSQYPFPAATLAVAVTKPPGFIFASSPGQADPQKVTHKFTDAITGIEVVNAPQDITVVDAFNLVARFKGANGPVRLSEKREMHFIPSSGSLTMKPAITTVNVGDFDSTTVLLPTYFGKSSVEVSTPGYQPVTFTVTVTWLSVLLSSLIGGFLGGVLAWLSAKDKPITSIVTGMIVGPVASWAYVVVGLPKIDTPLLHNQLAVIFVALIVGFCGIKGLTFIASKLGLPTP